MNQFTPNQWGKIRAYYAEIEHQLISEPQNDWVCGCYGWEREPMIFMTPIERALWHDIRALGCVLYPQYPIGGMFLDFANPKAKVCVECDGAAYHTDKAKDEKRDAWLEARGWSVYRFPGYVCFEECDEDKPGSTNRAYLALQKLGKAHGILQGRAQNDERSDDSGAWESSGSIIDKVIARFHGHSGGGL